MYNLQCCLIITISQQSNGYRYLLGCKPLISVFLTGELRKYINLVITVGSVTISFLISAEEKIISVIRGAELFSENVETLYNSVDRIAISK